MKSLRQRNLAALAFCFYRQRQGALLDRAGAKGDNLGAWGIIDNSVAMLAALLRIHFPLNAEGKIASQAIRITPRAPDVQQLNQEKLR
jgi:hypothetical protein